MSNWRSREFLDLCRGQQCFLQIDGVCNHDPDTVVPCHGNEAIYGKGMAEKASDEFTVPGCAACHHELDQGKRFHKEEKRAIWRQAWIRWIHFLFSTGLIIVAPQRSLK